MSEALLEPAAHGRVAANEVARLEQQVEEVEGAGAGSSASSYRVDRAPQFLLQRRGEVGVGIHPELVEVSAELLPAASITAARAHPCL